MNVNEEAIKFFGKHRLVPVGFRDIDGYGFSYLTTERCALGQRMLFDVNEIGKNTFVEWFGLPHGMKLASPWNSSVNGFDSVGSIMLERAVMMDSLLPYAVQRRVGSAVIPHLCRGFLSEVYGLQTGVLEEGLKNGFIVCQDKPPGAEYEFGVLYVKTIFRIKEIGPRVGPNNEHAMGRSS